MALEAVVFPHEHLACSTDKVAAAMSMYAPSLGRGISIVDEFEEKGGVVLQEEAANYAWAAAVEGNWDERRNHIAVERNRRRQMNDYLAVLRSSMPPSYAQRCLGLTVLHLNATATADHLVFYSFSLRMEDECRLSTVDEIAAAVHQMVAEVHAGGPC
ncbi:Transcription factor bHLH96 [Triticum urartu]|uniref:BHLH domain-containing protein n=2 Tax=Triticum TaxID=4564 RepID=A0A9R0Y6C6_TRITD|nr:Transcription factor bHLH96 [Triticum urartu]VAI49639.1 unnamed protein product [Triticum turgidum subsp. durum]